MIQLDLYSDYQRLRAKLILFANAEYQSQAVRVANDERGDGGRMG